MAALSALPQPRLLPTAPDDIGERWHECVCVCVCIMMTTAPVLLTPCPLCVFLQDGEVLDGSVASWRWIVKVSLISSFHLFSEKKQNIHTPQKSFTICHISTTNVSRCGILDQRKHERTICTVKSPAVALGTGWISSANFSLSALKFLLTLKKFCTHRFPWGNFSWLIGCFVKFQLI